MSTLTIERNKVLNSKNIWSKIQVISGWLALILLVVSIVSGYGWDIRTSGFVSNLTGGLLNRTFSADLHSFIVIFLVMALILHITPSVKRFYAKKSTR